MTFEEQLLQAVVAQFFAPEWVSYTTWNPQTQQNEQVMSQQPSPAARVAADIYKAKHEEILAAVKDKLDVSEIAEQVAAKVAADTVHRLAATGYYNGYDREQAELRKLVNARIADELARRALERMDREAEEATDAQA